ncbi:Uncharacterized protein TCAP_03812 [Tolypocladium capitatum]|uniref:Fe2OG dioxygenase domain-containing protein n=1 Tax=Tolypocladium capitatum TaxID=45235 RepID=A0A2K3QFC7_9HYPO|nr:Uncharacterized protein TCAP_03812 [Tolypocladium capitatum]
MQDAQAKGIKAVQDACFHPATIASGQPTGLAAVQAPPARRRPRARAPCRHAQDRAHPVFLPAFAVPRLRHVSQDAAAADDAVPAEARRRGPHARCGVCAAAVGADGAEGGAARERARQGPVVRLHGAAAMLTTETDAVDARGGEPVGLNPNIRVYRYSKGQYFDCHYDDDNNLTLPTEPPTPARTTWTLLLYLTSAAEGCVGGETVFYPHDRQSRAEEIAVPLETGMLLLHKHGDDCLLHEGREVTAGEKWVLRTDLCIGR